MIRRYVQYCTERENVSGYLPADYYDSRPLLDPEHLPQICDRFNARLYQSSAEILSVSVRIWDAVFVPLRLQLSDELCVFLGFYEKITASPAKTEHLEQ